MDGDVLSALLGPEQLDATPRKLHAVLFLAQSFSRQLLYQFSLRRGHVYSEDLDHDLIVIRFVGGGQSGSQLLPESDVHRDGYEAVCSQIRELLQKDDDVLDAAATSRFFGDSALGDPLAKLRWFSSLPVGTRREASMLVSDGK